MTPLDAIAGARHPDPFSFLGPHVVGDRVTIRAYLPAAETVSGWIIPFVKCGAGSPGDGMKQAMT